MKQYRYTVRGVLTALAAILILSSCQVTNRYESPRIEAENLFGESASADSASIGEIPWEEYFTDPALKALIEEGIESNHDLRIAYTRIRQAEAGLNIAKAAYFPEVALVGQVNHARSSNGERGKDVLGYRNTNYSLGVSVGWELDVWGKLNRQSRAKYAQFLNSHAYKNLIQTSLVANIATTYYSLLALDEKLAITVETAELMAENVQTMEDLKDAGLQNGAAVEQSKSLLYSTLTGIPDLESQIRQLENALCVMLGRTPGPVERHTLGDQRYPDRLACGVPVVELSRRPDVQQAELSFRSAFELTQAARASFYPSITLSTGSIGYATVNGLSSFFKPEHLFANIVGGLTQPLFAKRQLTGNLKIAKAQQEEALLTFERTVLEAGREVTDILYSFDSSLRKNETRQRQIEAGRKSVSFTHDLLKAGVANYTEVLTAEQNLLSAQLSSVNDRLEQLQCTVNLYRALGGGTEKGGPDL